MGLRGAIMLRWITDFDFNFPSVAMPQSEKARKFSLSLLFFSNRESRHMQLERNVRLHAHLPVDFFIVFLATSCFPAFENLVYTLSPVLLM